MGELVPANKLPEFGTIKSTYIDLQVNYKGKWYSFFPFYYDELRNSEPEYYISDFNHLKNKVVLGKIKMAPAYEIHIWASQNELRHGSILNHVHK